MTIEKIDILRSGLFKENPTFVQLLGMCPTLATTSSVKMVWAWAFL